MLNQDVYSNLVNGVAHYLPNIEGRLDRFDDRQNLLNNPLNQCLIFELLGPPFSGKSNGLREALEILYQYYPHIPIFAYNEFGPPHIRSPNGVPVREVQSKIENQMQHKVWLNNDKNVKANRRYEYLKVLGNIDLQDPIKTHMLNMEKLKLFDKHMSILEEYVGLFRKEFNYYGPWVCICERAYYDYLAVYKAMFNYLELFPEMSNYVFGLISNLNKKNNIEELILIHVDKIDAGIIYVNDIAHARERRKIMKGKETGGVVNPFTWDYLLSGYEKVLDNLGHLNDILGIGSVVIDGAQKGIYVNNIQFAEFVVATLESVLLRYNFDR